jgi:hypothetical protein
MSLRLTFYLALLFAASSVRAAPVTVSFGGTIEELIQVSGPPNSLLENVEPFVGKSFSGSFTYDDAQPNPMPGSVISLYGIPVPPQSLQTSIDGILWTAQVPYNLDLYLIQADEPPNIGLSAQLRSADGIDALFQLYLKDRFGHPLTSTDLDDIDWDLSLLPQHEASWAFTSPDFPGDSVTAFGHLTSLVAVPETEGGLLLAAAALTVGLARRACGGGEKEAARAT